MAIVDVTIGSGSEYRYALTVRIFDAYQLLKAEFIANQVVTVPLEEGIYTVRLELYGIIKDELVRVDSDYKYIALRKLPMGAEWEYYRLLALPEIYSAIPFIDTNFETYKSSEKYYVQAAVEGSAISTYQNNSTASESIFVFIRFLNQDKYQEFRHHWPADFSNIFFLLDKDAKPIASFTTENTIINQEFGYLVFSANLEPGHYFLKVVSSLATTLTPVHVFRGWHTQTFLNLSDRPQYATLRTLLSRSRAFEPENIQHKYFDILVDKLQSGDNSISDELINYVSQYECSSPMLALLCVYAYTVGNGPEHPGIEGMISSLEDLSIDDVRRSPDIEAINLMVQLNCDEMPDMQGTLESVPMLRMGLRAYRDAALKKPELLREYSILDYAIEGMKKGAAFTSFRWKEAFKVINQESNLRIEIQLSKFVNRMRNNQALPTPMINAILAASDVFLDEYVKRQTEHDKNNTFMNKFMQALEYLKKRFTSDETVVIEVQGRDAEFLRKMGQVASQGDISDTARGIATYLLTTPTATNEQASVELNVPQATVNRVVQEIESENLA